LVGFSLKPGKENAFYVPLALPFGYAQDKLSSGRIPHGEIAFSNYYI
jgi:hypothetical protein